MSPRTCPACSSVQEARAVVCAACGTPLADPPAPPPAPPLRLGPLAACAAALLAAVLLPRFVPALAGWSLPMERIDRAETVRDYGSLEQVLITEAIRRQGRVTWVDQQLRVVTERPSVVVSRPAGIGPLGRQMAVFALLGLAVAAGWRRRVAREAALAGTAGAAAQLLVWLQGSGWSPGLLLADTIYVVSPRGMLSFPSGLFVLSAAGFLVGAAALGAAAGGWGVERLFGRVSCPRCGTVRPRRSGVDDACPSCGASSAATDGRFRWAAAGAGATVAAFALLVPLLGPPLGFYRVCDRAEPSEGCRAALRTAFSEGSSWRVFTERTADETRRATRSTLLHPWKYLGLTAPLFAAAPLLLAWRLRRGGTAAAGIALVMAWAGASLTALLFFGLAGYEGAVMEGIRIHLIAVVAWGVAGAAGVAIGMRLGGGPRLDPEGPG